MTFGSLFAGIGGLDLGLERAGMECRWQVEWDDYCQKVLAKHWPNVRRYSDVKDCGGHNLEPVDLICGGFPCQPVSVAGKRKGDQDERWLWPEFYRIVCELRPKWVLVENVPGLLSVDDGRLMGGILADLAKSGYDAEWDCIPAAAVGAPHLRYRVFIVAHSNQDRCDQWAVQQAIQSQKQRPEGQEYTQLCSVVADARSPGLPLRQGEQATGRSCPQPSGGCVQPVFRQGIPPQRDGNWDIEPAVGGGADGFPYWLERHIGRGMSYEESARATQVLRNLWSEDVAQTVWRAVGGLDRIQKAEVLFAIMCQYKDNPDQARVFLASTEALEGFVCSLWKQGKITGSPHRPTHRKQSSREHPDTMQTVPRLLAFDSEPNWQVSSWEDGVPRVASGIPRRVDRLRSLGNAVVSQVAEWVGRRIMEAE